jgi:hypothetical protein
VLYSCPGIGIAEGNCIFDAWHAGIVLHEEFPTSVFGLRTTEVSQAEIFPLQISLVYINTLMLQQVLVEPTWQGRLTTTDLRALTPLKWQHVNPYGTFTLSMHERLVLERAA